MGLAYYAFDGDPGNGVIPTRPSLDDVGGASKEDDAAYPPDPITMPTASDWNQIAQISSGVARVCPVALISVKFASGTPYVSGLACPGTSLSAGSFTVTDLGSGDTKIAWAADALPVSSADPMATMNSDSSAVAIRAKLFQSSHYVEVTTKDAGGTGYDTDFTVQLF